MNKFTKTLVVVVMVALLAGFGYFVLHSKNTNQVAITPHLEKVRVQAGWLLNGEFANVCSAIINGYYKDAGLDVELVPGGPSGASFVIATNAIALDDSLTVGIDGDIIPLLRGVTKENPNEQLKVKIIGSFWNKNPYGFMVKEGSGLHSLKDFAKRKPDGTRYKIGVTSDSVIQFAIAKYIGVSVKDLDLVTVGFDAAPFLSGQVDAIAGYWTTQAYELEQAGVKYTFLPASELPGFDQPSMVVVATDKTIAEKKDTLTKWMRATIQGTEFVKQNPDIAAQGILDTRCGGPTFDKSQEEWLIRKSIPLFDEQKPGWVYENQIVDFAQAYRGLDQIPRTPTASELIDYSVLQGVYK